MTIRKAKTKAARYFICSGRTLAKSCDAQMPTIYADEFEKMIELKISEKLNSLIIKPKPDSISNSEIIKLKSDVMNIENSIDILLERLTEADSTTASYINQKIKSLDSEKTAILQQISRIEEAESQLPDFKALTNVMSVWNKLSFDDKRSVVQLVIEKILVFPDKVEIIWKF